MPGELSFYPAGFLDGFPGFWLAGSGLEVWKKRNSGRIGCVGIEKITIFVQNRLPVKTCPHDDVLFEAFAAFDAGRIVAFACNGTGNFGVVPTAYDTGTGRLFLLLKK